MIKKRCWISQINFFHKDLPHRINVLFFPSEFCVILTHGQELFFLGLRISIPNLEPCHGRGLLELSRFVFPIIVLPKHDRTYFAQKKRSGLSCWTMIWIICVVVDESKW